MGPNIFNCEKFIKQVNYSKSVLIWQEDTYTTSWSKHESGLKGDDLWNMICNVCVLVAYVVVVLKGCIIRVPNI